MTSTDLAVIDHLLQGPLAPPARIADFAQWKRSWKQMAPRWETPLDRALAGGVTAAQLLHGSANPIGGQAQVIKMRWGADAEALVVRPRDAMDNATPSGPSLAGELLDRIGHLDLDGVVEHGTAGHEGVELAVLAARVDAPGKRVEKVVVEGPAQPRGIEPGGVDAPQHPVGGIGQVGW